MRVVVNTLVATLALLAVTLERDADAAIDVRQVEAVVAVSPLGLAGFDPAPKDFPVFSRFTPYQDEFAAVAPLVDIAPSLSSVVNLPPLKLLDLAPADLAPEKAAPEAAQRDAAPPDVEEQAALSPEDLSPALMMPTLGEVEAFILPDEPELVTPKPGLPEVSMLAVEPAPAVELPALPSRRPRDADDAGGERVPSGLGKIVFATPVLAPMGHTLFCLKYPDDCRVQEAVLQAGPIKLTHERRAELVRVNAGVNSAIRPVNVSGVIADKWLIAPKTGNCNDYAVTKQHELLALGWPSRNLLLAEVVTTWGEHHLVLVVRTDKGDLVADSLDKRIRNWAETPYRWVRVQKPENPKLWATIETPQPDLVAMAGRDSQL